MSLGASLLESFLEGVATPLTAVCTLPLYPGFVAYLSAQSRREDGGGVPAAALGLAVVAGVVSFVGLVGFLFSYVLQESLTGVVATVSPVAFAVLAVVGVVLLADLDVFGRVPSVEPPDSRHPVPTAYLYGFFFGTIVIPCNPGFIALFFARVPILYDTFAESMLGFLAFGLGIGAPLLALAFVSEGAGQRVTRTLARHSGVVNRVTGAVMLAVSAYYLVYVFDVFGVA